MPRWREVLRDVGLILLLLVLDLGLYWDNTELHLHLTPTTGGVLAAALGGGAMLSYLAVVLAAWGVGRWRRANYLQVEHLQALRKVEARQAVSRERVRIARDLHDIVAHSVTVMLLQAAGARRVITADPADAALALDQIEAVGTQAMEELRRMLRLLRAADGGEPAPGPPGGLIDLNALLDRIRNAGVPIELTVQGTERHLDPSVDLTALLTIQEALTNVTKHAGAGARTTVVLRWGPELHIEVIDDGSGIRNARIQEWPTGHGLVGLRERLAVAGGRLECGPDPTGGFRVAAWLPTNASSTPRVPAPIGAS